MCIFSIAHSLQRINLKYCSVQRLQRMSMVSSHIPKLRSAIATCMVVNNSNRYPCSQFAAFNRLDCRWLNSHQTSIVSKSIVLSLCEWIGSLTQFYLNALLEAVSSSILCIWINRRIQAFIYKILIWRIHGHIVITWISQTFIFVHFINFVI